MADKNERDGSDIYDHRSRTGTVWWDCLVAVTLVAMALGLVALAAWGVIWMAGAAMLFSRPPQAGGT